MITRFFNIMSLAQSLHSYLYFKYLRKNQNAEDAVEAVREEFVKWRENIEATDVLGQSNFFELFERCLWFSCHVDDHSKMSQMLVGQANVIRRSIGDEYISKHYMIDIFVDYYESLGKAQQEQIEGLLKQYLQQEEERSGLFMNLDVKLLARYIKNDMAAYEIICEKLSGNSNFNRASFEKTTRNRPFEGPCR